MHWKQAVLRQNENKFLPQQTVTIKINGDKNKQWF